MGAYRQKEKRKKMEGKEDCQRLQPALLEKDGPKDKPEERSKTNERSKTILGSEA